MINFHSDISPVMEASIEKSRYNNESRYYDAFSAAPGRS